MAGNGYVTANRKRILEFLQKSDERAVTAADVSAYLKEQNCEVNITTVYRYLDKLAKDGVLIKYVAEKGGQSAYQYVQPGRDCSEHLHLKCVRCGRIIHLDCHFMKEISDHIKEEHEFLLQCRQSILYGVCRDCQEK